MKRLIPTRKELALFAAVAAICAVVASYLLSTEGAFFFIGGPIFVLAAWMGMRRSGQWAAIAAPVETKVRSTDNEPA